MKNVTTNCAYYTEQAEENGDAPISTMPDEVVREKELVAILTFLKWAKDTKKYVDILEIGCGNGFLMEKIDQEFGDRFRLNAIDITPRMIEIAKKRKTSCHFRVANLLEERIESPCADIIISERVIINILDPLEQDRAYEAISRMLRPGGVAIMIEGFKSGLDNINRARKQFMLPPIEEPKVNNWYTEERWIGFLRYGFEELKDVESLGLIAENFLSSHYFMTRFFHDCIKPDGGAIRNTEFAKFFSQVLPPVGDYSPLRIKYLRKK